VVEPQRLLDQDREAIDGLAHVDDVAAGIDLGVI
jgi:hypothetical protein